jgi:hypothetical protein
LAQEAKGLVSRGKYVLTIVDGTTNASWREPFELTSTEMPCMGVVDHRTDKFYAYHKGPIGEGGDKDTLPVLDVGVIQDFLESYLIGALTPQRTEL